MLPSTLCQLSVNVEAEQIVPRYFGVRDLRWLEALFDVYAEFVGQKRRVLTERLRDPLGQPAPISKLRIAIHVLDSLCKNRVSACVAPREARWAVFNTAARARGSREQSMAEAAANLGVSVEALEAALFADLEAEKCVTALPAALSPAVFVQVANQAIIKSLLRRALFVRVRAWDHASALVERTRELGLICTLEELGEAARDSSIDAAVLRISGPFSLFRRTEVYARALAQLLPPLTRCERFELEANCVLGRGRRALRLAVSSDDPIRAPERALESENGVRERFLRDFRRAAPHWEIEPVSPLIFAGSNNQADFELWHRSEPARRFRLEVLGFWTRKHLQERLKCAGESPLPTLLCIDESRACDDAALVEQPLCVRFKTRIDPARVLAIIEAENPGLSRCEQSAPAPARSAS